jgi:hypothetical protein
MRGMYGDVYADCYRAADSSATRCQRGGLIVRVTVCTSRVRTGIWTPDTAC